MTVTSTDQSGPVSTGGIDVWVARRGQGPDVLLLAGLERPRRGLAAPARRARRPLPADRLRQPGRRADPLPPDGPLGVTDMADDAAAVLRAARHRVRPRGRLLRRQRGPPRSWRCATPTSSAASCSSAPGPVRTPTSWRRATPDGGSGTCAPSDRAMLEAFFLWIYTPRAHADGMVAADHRGGARLPLPAAGGGLPAAARRLDGARHRRPAAADHRPDAGRRRRARRAHARRGSAGRSPS